MTAEPPGGRGLPRRRLLTLAALALPAACSTAPPVAAPPPATPQASTTPPTTSPTTPPTTSPTTPPTKPPATPAPIIKPAPKTSSATSKANPVPAHPGKAMFGAYLALGGMSLRESLALRRRQLGRDLRIVHVFYPWDGYVPRSEPAVHATSTLMVSWHGTAYRKIVDGSSDRVVARMARRLAGMRRPVLLRWGWEMNGDWFAWDGSHNGDDPAGYVRAWRRLHRIFREQGADNVAWVWSPNWNSSPDTAWNRFQRYYPGDEHVDWVGVSGYDFFGESPRTLFRAVSAEYGGRKPIILTETAAVDHGSVSKAAWIGKLQRWVEDTPAVGAVVWFDTDTQDDSPHNFRPDTDRAALAAYRAMARSSRFGG